MRARRHIAQAVACVLVLALLSAALVHRPAQAALLGTEASLRDSPARAGMVTTVSILQPATPRATLLREAVRLQLEDYGVAPDEARVRIEHMSDDEVARIAGDLDRLPAGGVVPAGLGPAGLVGVLLVGGIVVLLVLAAVWLFDD